MKDLEFFMKNNDPLIHSSDYNLSLIQHDYLIKNDSDLISLEKEIKRIFDLLFV